MERITTERKLETKLFDFVKSIGGIPMKLHSPWHNGKTDRLLIMPRGSTWFVEIKTKGKDLEPLQKIFRKEILALGHNYAFVDDLNSLEDLKTKLRNGI